VERILTRGGFTVHKARHGQEGIDLMAIHRLAIVLLDLKMPGMDGMEALGRILTIDPSVLVIVITGYATVETAIQAMKQGAYDFIPKPFEPDQLRITINRASEKIRLLREAEAMDRERRRTLIDLDTEKSRVRTIVESLPDGVVVTDPGGRVVLINPTCRVLLDLPADTKPGQPIEDYVPDKSLCDLVRDICKGRYVDFDEIPDKEFSLNREKFLVARAQPILGDNKACLGAVVTLGDISAFKVLDRLKSEFVAKVSHELRSPLSTIHEQLALVIKDIVEVAPSQDQHLLSRAKEKTKGLISLIGDLLDLSRIEAGAICNEPKPVQVAELLAAIVDFLATRAESKGQSLRLELAKDPLPLINADPLALESIFGNLITNAINYTPAGGKIHVTADTAGIHVRVKVADNGFGIAESHIDRIFERFYRVKDEKTRFITGTGLGLPIVKGLVDAMGGAIEVESSLGRGSTFTVLLPVKA
jgi:signal transduction histidine kinase/FixJ family two-component response regulator